MKTFKDQWIQTASGKKFFPFDPDPALIDPFDIATSLTNICRYAGHSRYYYSVAQHSALVSSVVPQEHAFAALLHDAAEAYVGDISRPMKVAIRERCGGLMDDVELLVMKAVCERFNVPWPLPPCVYEADDAVLVAEAKVLMAPLHKDWHYREENGFKAAAVRIESIPYHMQRMLFTVRWCDLTGDPLSVFNRDVREFHHWIYPLPRE